MNLTHIISYSRLRNLIRNPAKRWRQIISDLGNSKSTSSDTAGCAAKKFYPLKMVQGIVHNINNPLMAVSGFAEIAKMKLLEFIKSSANRIDEDQTLSLKDIIKTVEKVSSAADMTKALINTLLDKSRHESIEQKQKINLNKLIKQEIDFFKAHSKLKNAIKITLDLDQSIPEIFGIYTDFSQVVGNLTGNATDAMRNSSKKELGICTKHDNENIYILVKDTGEGISPANLKLIFDPFFTTKVCKDKGRSEKTGGTGLGLHTCKQLLKSYGADIFVKSSPGAGTVFKLSIPMINMFK